MRWLFLFFAFHASLFSSASLSDAGAYVVLDARTGKILDEKAKEEPLYPASCTKIATLLYIVSQSSDLPLQEKVVVPKEAVGVVSAQEKMKKDWNAVASYILERGSTTAGLLAGEIVTVQDLLYGMMLPSGNDAANVLAYYWGGRSIDAFMVRLNDFVKGMGLKQTHFCNPHGLPHPQHISSAYDLAMLAKRGLENPLFREVVRTYSYTKQKTNKQKNPVVWCNHNKLLKKGPLYLEEAIGVKTGYHQRAQHCLVAAAENSERTLILVVLKHPDCPLMFKQVKGVLRDYLQEKIVEKELISSGDLKLSCVIPGMAKPIAVQAKGAPFTVRYFPSEQPLFEAKVHWKSRFPPLSEEDEVGVLEIYRDSLRVASLPLVPAHTVPPTLSTRFYQLQEYVKTHAELCTLSALLALFVVGLGTYFVFRRK